MELIEGKRERRKRRGGGEKREGIFFCWNKMKKGKRKKGKKEKRKKGKRKKGKGKRKKHNIFIIYYLLSIYYIILFI
jgi:hypothetical protein